MKKILFVSALLLATTTIESCKKKGCTNVNAINFESKAKKDDGSCKYASDIVTELTEDVTSPLSFSNQTVKVCGDIDVTSQLTFGEGTIVIMCPEAQLTIEGSGSLNSTGTAAKPVTIRGESAVSGYYYGLVFDSNNPNNRLIYTNITDGGGYWYYDFTAVYVDENASLLMQNSRISNSKDFGLKAHAGSNLTGFQANIFSNNEGYGLRVNASNLKNLDVASSYNVSNGNNYLLVDGEVMGGNHTWKNFGQNVLLDGEFLIDGNITVNPGATFFGEAQAYLRIRSAGSFNAIGTSASPIGFYGKSSTPGFWTGFNFESNNASNVLSHCTISDAGYYWYTEYAALYIENSARLDVNNSSVSNTNNVGLYKSTSGSVYNNGSLVTTNAGLTAGNNFTNNGVGGGATCTTCSSNLP